MQAHNRQSWLKTARRPATLILAACLLVLVPIRAQAAPFSAWARGESVEALQEVLSMLGYYTACVDGIFGPLTDKAVRGFQSASGHPDGIVGPTVGAPTRQKFQQDRPSAAA